MIPVATLRPRAFPARLTAWRGASGRWLTSRLRAVFRGRYAPILITSIIFSGLMVGMGYVASSAQQAGAVIDSIHQANQRPQVSPPAPARKDVLFYLGR